MDITCGEVSLAVTEVDNLDQLEGMTVSILADGIVMDQQVVADGKITLNAAYAKINVGLPYESDIETLNIDRQLAIGSMQGRRVKIGNVMLRVINTLGGWIGPDEDHIYNAVTAAIQAKMDYVPGDFYTGDVRLPLGAGYEDGARVFYKQIDPLPVTITAFVQEISVGGPTE